MPVIDSMNVTVQPERIYEMLNELKSISGDSLQSIVTSETGKVLALCIKYTPAQKAARIRRTVKTKNSRVSIQGGDKYTENVTEGKEGRSWIVDESTWDKCNWGKGRKSNVQGRTEKPSKAGLIPHAIASNRHWSNRRWAKVLAMRALLEANKIDPKKAVKSRGLTKSTWLQIAKELGIDLDVPRYVEGTNTFRGKPTPIVGEGRKDSASEHFAIVITNASKILTGSRVDGRRILQRALDARVSAFRTELKTGVFNDIEMRARRYPGVTFH